jgi:hypothetical protein
MEASNASFCVCWCTTDVRCPHPISSKLAQYWKQNEELVDDIIGQFDRIAVTKYLRKDTLYKDAKKLAVKNLESVVNVREFISYHSVLALTFVFIKAV